MSDILILYTSITGNTEQMAEIIQEALEDNGYEVDRKMLESDDFDIQDITSYRAFLFGTYTYEDGQLPYEVEDFCDDLETVDLRGMMAGVFGSGDTSYATFGGAIDLVAEKLKSLGAVLHPERLKVDLDPDDEDTIRCREFAGGLCELLEEKLGA